MLKVDWASQISTHLGPDIAVILYLSICGQIVVKKQLSVV